jgi:predicted RNase H-like nuclease (RuvC/YqgF family)
MSTAPLSAFIPKQPQGHYLGSIKPKLKVKETKAELKAYSEKLETALAQVKKKAAEFEKDCERVNKEYMKEVRRGERRRELVQSIKASFNTLIQSNRLCDSCRFLNEFSAFSKLLKERDQESQAEMSFSTPQSQ